MKTSSVVIILSIVHFLKSVFIVVFLMSFLSPNKESVIFSLIFK